MRLSEAIRLGSMLRPQTYGSYFDGHGSCALGAANESAGLVDAGEFGRIHTRGEQPFLDVFPIAAQSTLCPACLRDGVNPRCGTKGQPWRLDGVIGNLNDIHRWTRERIADFVESVEATQALEEARATNAVDPHAQLSGTPSPRVSSSSSSDSEVH